MMHRRALFTIVALLLALVGSDLVALCASVQAAGSCCCPVEGPPPCLDESGTADAPMPESEGVVETAPSLQAATLPATETAARPWSIAAAPAVVEPDPASPSAPSPHLLACVWLC